MNKFTIIMLFSCFFAPNILISQNIDIAVVAARLGHAQITTTLNFYVHPVISHNKVAGNVLQNLLLAPKD